MSQQGQGDVAARLRSWGDQRLDTQHDPERTQWLFDAAAEIDRLRTLLSSSRGEQGWRTPDDLPELKDGDRFAVYLAFDTGEVKLADWVAWTETASEYHASTGVYLGQSPQDGDALYMTDDGFDVRKDDHGRWVSHKHHDDGTKTPFYVTAWTEALKPLPSAPGSVPTSAAQGWREALVTASMALTAHNDWQLKRTDPEVLDGVEYIYELTDDALSRIKACEAGSVPTSLAGQVPDGYAKALQEISALAATFDDEREAGYIAVAKLGRIARAALIAAAPQPTAGGDAPTDRASPIQPYGPDDDENIFALLCARKDARTDTSAKAIAWAEDEIENLRSERNDLVTKVNALSELETALKGAIANLEHVSVFDEADDDDQEAIEARSAWQRDLDRFRTALRALGQQDTE